MAFTQPFKASHEEPLRRTMCEGTTKQGPRAGMPCGRVAVLGGSYCIFHGASLPHVQEEARNMVMAARVEMMGQATDAAKVIYDLAQNAASEAVRLKAAESLLDRVGVRGGTELTVQAEVTVSRATDILNERLGKLKTAADRTREQQAERVQALELEVAAAEEVLEGEIVETEDAGSPAPSFPPGYLGRLSRHRATEPAAESDTEPFVVEGEIAPPPPD